MSDLKTQLEQSLIGIRSLRNPQQLEQLVGQLVANSTLAITSQLATQLGESVSGFTSLATGVDDIVPQVTGSAPQQVAGQFGVVQLNSNLPEIGSQMQTNGNLDVVISAPFPAAVTAAAQQITNNSVYTAATPTQLTNLAGRVLDTSLPITRDASDAMSGPVDDFETLIQDTMDKALRGVVGPIIGVAENSLKQLTSSLSTVISSAESRITSSLNYGFSSLLQNLSEDKFSLVRNQLSTVARKDNVLQQISERDLRRIIQYVEVGDINGALPIVRRYSDLEDDVIYDALRSLDTSVGSITSPSVDPSLSPPSVDKVDPNSQLFEIIHNQTALDAEFQSISREATVVIITHTSSYNDQNLSAARIELASSALGGCPYHYVIRRDGAIERGRAAELPAYTLTTHPNYNDRSLLIGLVGGINSPKPSTNQTPDFSNARQSFTRQQWTSLDMLISSAYKAYPGVQVIGRSSLGDAPQRPGFDVEEYIQKWNKVNMIDPLLHNAPTRIEIRTGQVVERGSTPPNLSGEPV
jgi:N-acetylmuramoyl-L-alanine amidase